MPNLTLEEMGNSNLMAVLGLDLGLGNILTPELGIHLTPELGNHQNHTVLCRGEYTWTSIPGHNFDTAEALTHRFCRCTLPWCGEPPSF